MAYLGNDFDPEIGSVPSVIKAGEKASIPADKQLVVEGLDIQGDLDIQGTLATVTGGSLSKTTMKTESIENSVNAGNPVAFAVTPTVGGSEVVDSINNQTVDGVKTFSSSPIVPTPMAGDSSTKVATTAFVQSSGAVIGSVIILPTSNVPNGYLECDGSELSRTAYSNLFNTIGELYGSGDGSTTFNIPDLRGEFIRGFDNNRGIDSGRAIGSSQADEFESHTHTELHLGTGSNYGFGYGAGGSSVIYYRQANTGSTGGVETRPRNIAMMYCIKY